MEFAMSDQHAPRIERLPAVVARTGLSRSTIYALIARGDFVRPLKLAGRAMGFLSADIDSWILRKARPSP
jgi:prophage regulatory protein